MARKLLILALTALMALPSVVFASGGPNPPPQNPVKLTGPAISATIVMDPHNPGVTPRAGMASIQMRKGPLSAGAVFMLPESFTLNLGCVKEPLPPDNALGLPAGTNLTEVRFVNKPLTDWIEHGIVTKLLWSFGVEVSASNVPVITTVDNVTCTLDPDALTPPSPAEPGFLSFDAVIQMRVPAK